MKLADRLRTRRHGPLTRDRCEVCGKWLRARQRVEITDAPMTFSEGGVTGWGSMTATYCTAHDPRTP